MATYRQDIDRRRFAGESPLVRPKRGPLETAAAAIAAERLRGVLEIGGAALSPAEDLAAEELYGALRAMAVWDFSLARRRLELAGDYARLPAMQQEVRLARELYQLARAVHMTDPSDKWGDADQVLLDLLPTLDRVLDDEKLFYRGEARRLARVWTEAGTDEAAWVGWALARGRAAGREGGREAGLAWLLRIYRRVADRLGEDSLLAAAIDQAEALFRLLLPEGVASEEERAALEAQAANAWPRDLLPLLVAALDRAYAADLIEVSNRYALMIYRAPVVPIGNAR